MESNLASLSTNASTVVSGMYGSIPEATDAFIYPLSQLAEELRNVPTQRNGDNQSEGPQADHNKQSGTSLAIANPIGGSNPTQEEALKYPHVFSDNLRGSVEEKKVGVESGYLAACNQQASTLLKKALQCHYKGQKRDALQHLDDAKSVIEKCCDKKYYWMLKQASIYLALEEEKSYKQLVHRVEEDLHNIEYNKDIVESIIILNLMQARDLIDQDSLEEASRMLDIVDSISKSTGFEEVREKHLDFYKEYKGKLLLKQGKIASLKGNTKEAEQFLNEADNCYEEVSNKREKSNHRLRSLSYVNRSQLYIEWAKLDPKRKYKKSAGDCLKNATDAINCFLADGNEDDKDPGIIDYRIPKVEKIWDELESINSSK